MQEINSCEIEGNRQDISEARDLLSYIYFTDTVLLYIDNMNTIWTT